MTVVVVNPRDIREDAELVLLGLERLRGKKFQEMVDEVYASDENLTFGWFGLRQVRKIHTRRDIAITLDAHLNPSKWNVQPENEDILQWWATELALAGYHGYMEGHIRSVRRLIESAESLNAAELHVPATTLRRFEEAYEVGAHQCDTEE